MTRQAAAIAYDNSGNFALTIGSRNSSNVDAAVDTGTASVPANERTEALATLKAEGFLVGSASYVSDWSTHAQADVLVELIDTQPRSKVTNTTIFRTPTLRLQPVAAKVTNTSTFYSPTITHT